MLASDFHLKVAPTHMCTEAARLLHLLDIHVSGPVQLLSNLTVLMFFMRVCIHISKDFMMQMLLLSKLSKSTSVAFPCTLYTSKSFSRFPCQVEEKHCFKIYFLFASRLAVSNQTIRTARFGENNIGYLIRRPRGAWFIRIKVNGWFNWVTAVLKQQDVWVPTNSAWGGTNHEPWAQEQVVGEMGKRKAVIRINNPNLLKSAPDIVPEGASEVLPSPTQEGTTAY